MKSKRHILLVDDDRLVLATLTQGLLKAGFNVSTAESVDEAENILASGERPDLIILDVRMPGRDGLELAERLRSLDNISFILLTAYCDREIIDQATAYGALGYLVKPIETKQLIPAIEAAMCRAGELKALRTQENNLQHALNSERDISVATGITMVMYRLSRNAAFEQLRKTARSQGKKMVVLAAELIRAYEAVNIKSIKNENTK